MGQPKREKREVSTARPGRRNTPWMSPTRELAAAEGLALQIYPWSRLELEVETTDAIFSLPPDEARLSRAIWWAVHQLHGADGGESFNAIYPNAARPVTKDEWLAIGGVAPVTLDETAIGAIVAFAFAARALLISEPVDERIVVHQIMVEAAIGIRPLWKTMIDEARNGEDGVKLVDLGGGWLRFEDEESTDALKRVLKRNGQRAQA
jgi:hypothetical protein